jgi:hypothetical protein
MSATNAFTVVVLTAPGLTLQSADSLTGSFSDETGAVIDPVQKTITTPVTTAARFYRLRSQSSTRIVRISVDAGQVTIEYE